MALKQTYKLKGDEMLTNNIIKWIETLMVMRTIPNTVFNTSSKMLTGIEPPPPQCIKQNLR